jgi:uncharacterized membrane protein
VKGDRSLWLKLFAGLTVFSLVGSFASQRFGLDPGPVAPGASALTLAFGLAAVYSSLFAVWGWQRALGAMALLGLVGAASEVVGLYTGAVFGSYTYTGAWWPSISLPGDKSFPLLLPGAWMMMAGGAYLTVRSLAPQAPLWAAAMGGGVLAAAIDLPMEHVMVNVLAYWTWTEPGPLPGGAPWANTLGWVAVSTVGSLILAAFEQGSGRLGEGAEGSKMSREPMEVLFLHCVLLAGLALIGPLSP